MKKHTWLVWTIFLLLWGVVLGCVQDAFAIVPGYVPVFGSNLVDSTGMLVANATIAFTPVTNAGPPISYDVVSTAQGQATSQPATAVVNAATAAGSDIGAQVTAVAASSACSVKCTILIPAGLYTQTTAATIANPNIVVQGFGAHLNAGSGLTAMMNVTGSHSVIEGVTFNLAGHATYGVVVGGSAADVTVRENTFMGAGAYGIYANYAGAGLAVTNNTFKSDSGGFGPGPMTLQFISDFRVTGNHFYNTLGFGIPTIGSHSGVIANNDFDEPQFVQTIISPSGKTSFSVTLPSHATRLFAKVNGVPTSLASATNMSGNTWTATFATAPGSGAVVQFLGFQSLEDIQINSQSFGMAVNKNSLNGSGDSGIDVVSDYHAKILSTITATNGQKVFNFTGAVTFFAGVEINGRMLSGADIVKGGPVRGAGNTWTVTLSTPQPSGTMVSFVDFYINGSASTKADYPGDVTIDGNTVRGIAAAGIAVEIPSPNSVITNNVVEDCGQGIGAALPTYQSGIYVAGGSPLVLRNNSLVNSVAPPTMRTGIFMLGFSRDTGSPQKSVLVGGNTFRGTFPTQLSIPTSSPTTRQAGIDLLGVSIPYPEGVQLDNNWSGLPSQTNYFSYTQHNASVTRDTTHGIGGAASLKVATSGDTASSQFNIYLSDYRQFANSILRISFWAQLLSGTRDDFQVWSSAGGEYYPVVVAITSTAWQHYVVNVSTQGLDRNQPVFIRVSSPGATSATVALSNMSFSSTPINASAGSVGE